MKAIKLITVISLFFTFCSSAQTLTDKKEIYKVVIETIADNQVAIINETFTRIYKYDIDGNYDKGFYQKYNQNSSDTAQLTASAVCVIPIEYTQPVMAFLQSQNIATKDLTNQVDNQKLHSLHNYISNGQDCILEKSAFGKF